MHGAPEILRSAWRSPETFRGGSTEATLEGTWASLWDTRGREQKGHVLRSRHWQSPVGPRMGGGRSGVRHTGSAGTREGRACPAPWEPPEDSEWCGPTCTNSGSSRKDGGKCEATQTSSQCSWNQPIQLLGLHQCPSPGPQQGPPRHSPCTLGPCLSLPCTPTGQPELYS